MTRQDKQNIIDSIHHWYKDCVDLMQDGWILHESDYGYLFWRNPHEFYYSPYFHKEQIRQIFTKLNAIDCPLCQKYLQQSRCNKCHKCPWFVQSGKACYGQEQEWSNLMEERDIASAYAVVNKLWNIGIQKKQAEYDISHSTYFSYD